MSRWSGEQRRAVRIYVRPLNFQHQNYDSIDMRGIMTKTLAVSIANLELTSIRSLSPANDPTTQQRFSIDDMIGFVVSPAFIYKLFRNNSYKLALEISWRSSTTRVCQSSLPTSTSISNKYYGY